MTKRKLQFTLGEDVIRWIDEEVEKHRFADRSQAVEEALRQLIKQGKTSLMVESTKALELHKREKR